MKKGFVGILVGIPLMLGSAAYAADESVEVLHYFTSGGEAAAINELKKSFEAEGGTWIDTPVAGGGGEAHDQTLKSRALAGNPPGAAMPKLFDAQTWGKDGYLVDLSEVAAAEKWEEIYPDAIKNAAKYDGKWVAVPIDLLRADMMWVNPKVLEKVGAKVPTTWEEFNETSDKLKAAGITPLAHGGQSWQDALLFEYAVVGVGGAELHHKVFVEGDLDAIKSDKTKAAFDQMRKLRGYVDKDFSGRDWNLATAMLMKGDAAFQMMGDWTKGEVTAAGLKPGVDILCVPTPRTTQGPFLWISNSMSFFAAKKGDPTATPGQKKLAAVLSRAEPETNYALKKGGAVARIGVDTAPFDACAKFEIESAGEANKLGMLNGDLVGGMTPLAGARGAVYDVVTNFFNTDMSSDDAVQKLADAIELAR